MSIISTAIAPYRLYAELGAAALLLVGFLWWNHHERSIGAEQCKADQIQQAEKDKKQGEAAVAKALEAARLDAEKEAAARKKAADEQAQAIQDKANAEHAKAVDLQRRYEHQLATDKGCADWTPEKVACVLE